MGVWVGGRGGYAWYLRTSKLDYHITLTCLSHDLTCEIIATKAQGRSIKRGILTKYSWNAADSANTESWAPNLGIPMLTRGL